jgi:LuxR family maltose regulon positive regulatory protein
LYQWNRLEEARSRLHTMLHDAASWQHQDLLGWGCINMMRVELARGDPAAAEQALHALEDLVRRERYGPYPSALPAVQALWLLAQGQVTEAAAWAASVVFHDGAWESILYSTFPIAIQTYFAERRWQEALALLERWSEHLDRRANIRTTIAYLAQLLVALQQTNQHERARETATRLIALTEPEGYIRVYLDNGEPMRQALQALLLSCSQQHRSPPLARTYVAKLLAAFERDQPHVGRSQEQGATSFPAPTLALALTSREREVLRLLAEGASNHEIAETLMIELSTVKKHVSNLLSKLGVPNRTRAIAQARARSLL